jgi:hypothetical protein
MTGWNDTDQYDNATVDNWVMTLGGALGLRFCGASVEYDSTAGTTDVTNILGSISPNTTRSSTGLQKHQYSPAGGKDVMGVFPTASDVDNQVFVYSAGKDDFRIMTLTWTGADFELSDEPYYVYTLGR